ncbi:hypothetical protein L9F63_020142, partial [Diploptera punctata]
LQNLIDSRKKKKWNRREPMVIDQLLTTKINESTADTINRSGNFAVVIIIKYANLRSSLTETVTAYFTAELSGHVYICKLCMIYLKA